MRLALPPCVCRKPLISGNVMEGRRRLRNKLLSSLKTAMAEDTDDFIYGELVSAEKKYVKPSVPSHKGSTPREIALDILLKREVGGSNTFIENILHEVLLESSLSTSDRGFCKELIYGCIRWRGLLDHLISRRQDGKKRQRAMVQVILRVGLYQLFFMDRIPSHALVSECVNLAKSRGIGGASGFINAFLRQYVREQAETRELIAELQENTLHVGWSHPEWIVKEWVKRYGKEEAKKLLSWNNSPATMFARVNRIKSTGQTVRKLWEHEPITFRDVNVDWCNSEDLAEIKVTAPVQTLESFKRGFFYVQDPSTLLSVKVLDPQPGDSILDLCSAPGGKACYIAQLMEDKGKLIASDIDEDRLKVVRQNSERLGITCLETKPVSEVDRMLAGDEQMMFDRILIDAPCSNSGVIRRRIDVRWRISKTEIAALHETQFGLLMKVPETQEAPIFFGKIFSQAATAVKKGGILVYSTCSIEPEENEHVIRRFLKRSEIR
eukprot:763138-Hanusia_phi.AAC.1